MDTKESAVFVTIDLRIAAETDARLSWRIESKDESNASGIAVASLVIACKISVGMCIVFDATQILFHLRS